jgi:hypothetical protein
MVKNITFNKRLTISLVPAIIAAVTLEYFQASLITVLVIGAIVAYAIVQFDHRVILPYFDVKKT